MSQTLDVNIILKDLKALNDTNTLDVFLPSTGETVKFKKLTIKQQKNLVMVALDDITSQLNFSLALYDIIQENIVNYDSSKLTIFDKNSIVFTILEDNAISSSKPSKEVLGEIVKKYKEIIEQKFSTISITNGSVVIEMPTLYTDYRYNKTLQTKYNGEVGDRKKFVSDVYLLELCKYIKSIKFSNGVTIELLDYTLSEFLTIVENLPSMSKIMQTIGDIKEHETKLNTVNGEQININPSLFI